MPWVWLDGTKAWKDPMVLETLTLYPASSSFIPEDWMMSLSLKDEKQAMGRLHQDVIADLER